MSDATVNATAAAAAEASDSVAAGAPLISLDHVTVEFGRGKNRFRAVDDVSLTINKGSIYGIIGFSGAGKSTLVRTMNVLQRPTSGTVTFNGTTISTLGEGRLLPLRRKIAMIFQHFNLMPSRTVLDNVTLPLIHEKVSRKDARAKAMHLLELVGIADKAKAYPRQLSGGQQQRTALARILAYEPAALLLDEPFSALDSFLKWNLEMELTEVLDSFAGPAIWVSHDRGEAFRNCRWVCVMDQGKTLPAQAMDELFFSPGTEAAARLTGCKNYARAIPNGNTVTLREWGIALRCAEKAGSMVQCVGIRAHSVRPATLGEENAFSCTVERIIQDVFSTIILLRPVGATQEAPLLWMEMDKNNGQKIHNSRTLTVAVAPQQIMLLH